ncbi:hypothetical protein H310_11607 [Aphanomyces invadans]|uniref:Uncharacterized protein n=1 Tax=Aphanomyces invadans TaxID=157072 RepID=A0A024TMY1_9STRA|nr:hypothetical protein H310_11607 [Aphanomyces invadans]ETV94966.1 hypothetical protein H310_11607 [Aphanomyces invadans]|eukprot:XP_008876557.1 hypothetical protein H310_11607 [Aphanomyces invadans]
MNSEDIAFALQIFKWAKRKKLKPHITSMLLEYALGLPAERPLIPAIRFDINMRDADSILSFRFNVAGVLQLTSLLGVPNAVITSCRDRVIGVEALAIMLKRLRYPITYYDLLATFGRSREQICRIFNHMINLVYNNWKDHIYCNKRIVRSRISAYAKAIFEKVPRPMELADSTCKKGSTLGTNECIV